MQAKYLPVNLQKPINIGIRIATLLRERSFGNLHGSDMMEPVAIGAAVVTGPAVQDFQDTVDALLAGDGLVQATREQLADVLAELLGNPQRRKQLAENGRAVLEQQQGATGRNAELIRKAIGPA